MKEKMKKEGGAKIIERKKMAYVSHQAYINNDENQHQWRHSMKM